MNVYFSSDIECLMFYFSSNKPRESPPPSYYSVEIRKNPDDVTVNTPQHGGGADNVDGLTTRGAYIPDLLNPGKYTKK